MNSAPVDNSENAVVQSSNSSSPLHPIFGHGATAGYYINNMPVNTPQVTVYPVYNDSSDLVPIGGGTGIPFGDGSGVVIEGAGTDNAGNPIYGLAPQSSAGSDAHLFIHVPGLNNLDQLFEGYAVSKGPGIPILPTDWLGWAVFNLNSNNMRPLGWSSANAAGLAAVPLLVKWDEVASGQINHMLTYTMEPTGTVCRWPASHSASLGGTIQLGDIWFLDQNYDISSFSPTNQVILTALKKYGMIISDNGLNGGILGCGSVNWSDDDLHNLLKVTLGNGYVANVTGYQVSPTSYEAGAGPGITSIGSTPASQGGASVSGVLSHHSNSQPRAMFKQ
jgi:hypothetical protein